MNFQNTPITLAEAKIQASKLLKTIRSDNAESVAAAIVRIRQTPILKDTSDNKLAESFKRKHALAVIAIENDFQNWADLKQALETPISEDFVTIYINGFLNQWFTDYQAAKVYQNEHGGYLLPYKTQYFVCNRDFMDAIGFENHHQDFEKIAFDWVQPADTVAFKKLRKKLAKLTRK